MGWGREGWARGGMGRDEAGWGRMKWDGVGGNSIVVPAMRSERPVMGEHPNAEQCFEYFSHGKYRLRRGLWPQARCHRGAVGD